LFITYLVQIKAFLYDQYDRKSTIHIFTPRENNRLLDYYTIKTDRYDIAEILLKVALNTITLTLTHKNHTILRELMKYIRRSETS
jgi:hypothetical protein